MALLRRENMEILKRVNQLQVAPKGSFWRGETPRLFKNIEITPLRRFGKITVGCSEAGYFWL